jgi:hypothetical protein
MQPQKAVKKPIAVEVFHFDGSAKCAAAIEMWSEGEALIGGIPTDAHNNHTLLITTKEGVMTASPNDWIIKGVKGEFYPCKPDIFAATYGIADWNPQ